ncbi:hypothetical protein [Streptomyces aidingensis]|uniref:Secreted protein n=1 Tax=Streptomyces aidingensis TaxID=910347 RepID=A0A1I1N6D8_9ACTN|nr:hypothetical protein [Streptomyces aidingensis]SFC93241.1 hypothetical protein SAMN05421773_107252 [Streptomyces aidingensis]
MRMRHLWGAAVVAAGVLGPVVGAGTAVADTNINTHSPSMMCQTGQLSASASTSACVARQSVDQGVLKTHTRDVDLINRLDIVVPAALGV